MADALAPDLPLAVTGLRPRRRSPISHKALIAFIFALPLMVVIGSLVVYPALYAIHLATLNKSMHHFVGWDNFTFLFKRNTFWMVVEQSVMFAVTAVIFKALIGFIAAHFVHNLPARGQRKWRGMRSEEHTSELQSLTNLVCRLLLEKKKKQAESEQ